MPSLSPRPSISERPRSAGELCFGTGGVLRLSRAATERVWKAPRKSWADCCRTDVALDYHQGKIRVKPSDVKSPMLRGSSEWFVVMADFWLLSITARSWICCHPKRKILKNCQCRRMRMEYTAWFQRDPYLLACGQTMILRLYPCQVLGFSYVPIIEVLQWMHRAKLRS